MYSCEYFHVIVWHHRRLPDNDPNVFRWWQRFYIGVKFPCYKVDGQLGSSLGITVGISYLTNRLGMECGSSQTRAVFLACNVTTRTILTDSPRVGYVCLAVRFIRVSTPTIIRTNDGVATEIHANITYGAIGSNSRVRHDWYAMSAASRWILK